MIAVFRSGLIINLLACFTVMLAAQEDPFRDNEDIFMEYSDSVLLT
ncbi:MAG: hypothetical protein PHD61_07085 [Bacteroidales bacterium]|nr:hypothetical protein [Bacteroidales bacterium]